MRLLKIFTLIATLFMTACSSKASTHNVEGMDAASKLIEAQGIKHDCGTGNPCNQHD